MNTKKSIAALCVLLFSSTMLAFPSEGVFGAIGEDFSDTLAQQSQILALIHSLTTSCCSSTPTAIFTPIAQTDINGGTYQITTSGNYKVVEDLIAMTNQNVIQISTDNVNLDLQGFTIDGDNQAPNIILVDDGTNEITISNGEILKASNDGILLNGSSGIGHIQLEMITSNTNQGNGFHILICTDYTLSQCNASFNSDDGILVDGNTTSGIVIGESAASKSQFNNNSNGMHATNQAILNIKWCNASSNSDDGIFHDQATGLVLQSDGTGNITGATYHGLHTGGTGSYSAYRNNTNFNSTDFTPNEAQHANINLGNTP